MAVGSDIQVFISASRALLQSVNQRSLTEEEQEELRSCLDELAKILPRHRETGTDRGRNAA